MCYDSSNNDDDNDIHNHNTNEHISNNNDNMFQIITMICYLKLKLKTVPMN